MKRYTRLRRHTPLRATPLRPVRRGNRALARGRKAVQERSGGRCEVGVPGVCRRVGSQAHHRLMRSQGGPDTADNLLWTCGPCHEAIHSYPATSYENGWLLHRLPAAGGAA